MITEEIISDCDQINKLDNVPMPSPINHTPSQPSITGAADIFINNNSNNNNILLRSFSSDYNGLRIILSENANQNKSLGN